MGGRTDVPIYEYEDLQNECEELEKALNIAIDYILGGGLTEEGKRKWREGLVSYDPVLAVERAIALTDGMIAT